MYEIMEYNDEIYSEYIKSMGYIDEKTHVKITYNPLITLTKEQLIPKKLRRFLLREIDSLIMYVSSLKRGIGSPMLSPNNQHLLDMYKLKEIFDLMQNAPDNYLALKSLKSNQYICTVCHTLNNALMYIDIYKV